MMTCKREALSTWTRWDGLVEWWLELQCDGHAHCLWRFGPVVHWHDDLQKGGFVDLDKIVGADGFLWGVFVDGASNVGTGMSTLGSGAGGVGTCTLGSGTGGRGICLCGVVAHSKIWAIWMQALVTLDPQVKEGVRLATLSWMSRVSASVVVWRKHLSAVTLGKGTVRGNESAVRASLTLEVLGA